MDISNINGISTGDIKSFFNNTSLTKTDKTDSFSDVLSAAMGSIGETNDLQNAAEQEEVRFALGESDNTHDLLVAETKAAVALQYTVAVRDKICHFSRHYYCLRLYSGFHLMSHLPGLFYQPETRVWL